MRSDPLTKGINAAPQRSLLKALGLCDAEIGKPLIGVVSSQNDIVPGHMNLDKIVNAVKQGVALGGGVPIVFPAIAVCDGLAMGHVGMKYSLVSRELICDSTEAMATAHPFDGLVLVAACDKNVPGLLMAAARLNIPSIVISGGAMLAGHFEGRKVSYSNISEAVSQFRTGKITPIQFEDLENKACPSCGSCSGMFTANSMNCLSEVLGMALPGNGTIPAVHSARLRLAKESGMKIMELVKNNVLPRQIMTKDAFLNALAVDMALGCSTNSMLHLPAIAHECGIDLDLSVANEISKKTPNLCHLAPAGNHYIEELDEAGGIRAVMNEVSKLGVLHLDCLTVTRKTVGENIAGAKILDPEKLDLEGKPYWIKSLCRDGKLLIDSVPRDGNVYTYYDHLVVLRNGKRIDTYGNIILDDREVLIAKLINDGAIECLDPNQQILDNGKPTHYFKNTSVRFKYKGYFFELYYYPFYNENDIYLLEDNPNTPDPYCKRQNVQESVTDDSQKYYCFRFGENPTQESIKNSMDKLIEEGSREHVIKRKS